MRREGCGGGITAANAAQQHTRWLQDGTVARSAAKCLQRLAVKLMGSLACSANCTAFRLGRPWCSRTPLPRGGRCRNLRPTTAPWSGPPLGRGRGRQAGQCLQCSCHASTGMHGILRKGGSTDPRLLPLNSSTTHLQSKSSKFKLWTPLSMQLPLPPT